MILDSFGDLWWKFGKLILLCEWLRESARRFLEKQEREKLHGPSRQGIPCRRTRTTVRRARDWDYIASSSGSEEEERDSLAARSIILIPELIPSIIDRKLWPWSHTPQSAEKSSVSSYQSIAKAANERTRTRSTPNHRRIFRSNEDWLGLNQIPVNERTMNDCSKVYYNGTQSE